MAKILLVEDDNNLREIYEARLNAEGYEIVSARDGEEALTIAMKERPDLIISDVMMPKISGFDMLDILRSTEETKKAKIIMMTALSQAEDKDRAEKLGADRYLVKSQVTLEDVAKVAKEVLEGVPAPVEQSTPTPLVAAEPAASPTPPTEPATPPAPAPATPAEPATPPATPAQPDPTPTPAPAPTPDPTPPTEPATPPAPATTTSEESDASVESKPDEQNQSTEASSSAPEPAPTQNDNESEIPREKIVLQPINDLNEDKSEKLQQLLAAEETKSQMANVVAQAANTQKTIEEEEKAIAEQLKQSAQAAQAQNETQTDTSSAQATTQEDTPLPPPKTPPADNANPSDPNAIAL